MQDLAVIGVEDGSLVLSSESGDRFRIAIDDTLTSTLRRATPPSASGRKPAPRDIQAQIRAGMSAEDVAALTGAPLEYVERFEGPVLAEREFIVESALNVPVHTALDIDPMSQGSTFGSVIRDRLHDLGASDERWASWKEAEGGWVVKLAFTADEIDHDARWRYEPKKSALAPLNGEAHTLSQQGELPNGLIPRLRAVGGDERASNSSRFDSGAFDVRTTGELGRDTAAPAEASFFGRISESSPEVAAAAIKRAPVEEIESTQTADLLEALRRRRGEREAASSWTDDDPMSDHPSSGSPQTDGRSFDPRDTGRVHLVDIPLDPFDDGVATTAPQPLAPRAAAKKGRTAMPSWDEIVFGARSDDDPA